MHDFLIKHNKLNWYFLQIIEEKNDQNINKNLTMTNEFISVFKIPAHDHRFNQAERQHCYLLNVAFVEGKC